MAEDGVRFVRAELARFCGELEGLAPAVRSYLANILAHRPDEQAVLGFAVESA